MNDRDNENAEGHAGATVAASSEEKSMSEHIEVRSNQSPQAVVEPSDGDPDELAHGRYLDALHDLVEDAAAGQRMHLLADVVAWTFARLASGCGPAATADLLTKVGKYMGALEAQNEAKRELERERQEGRLPN